MKDSRRRKRIVLSIYFNTRGFAYSVFDDPSSPLQWGVKAANPGNVTDRFEKARLTILMYRPSVVVLQDCDGDLSRCTSNVRKAVDKVADFASKQQIEVSRFSRSDILCAFAPYRAHTKHEIAKAIAVLLPEFAPHVPPKRLQWKGEAHRMFFFDAVSLALSYYSDPSRSAHGP